jgi:hypothetical protein
MRTLVCTHRKNNNETQGVVEEYRMYSSSTRRQLQFQDHAALGHEGLPQKVTFAQV